MRIGVDIDGVLADWDTAFLRVLCRTTGLTSDLLVAAPHFLPHTWDWPTTMGFTDTQVVVALAESHQSDQFWLSLAPYPDTRQVLDRLFVLEARGDDVYFITNRHGVRAKAQTEQWLKHCGFLARPTVLISREKGLCAHALDLDYYIDDNVDNVRSVWGMMGGHVYLLNRPWNEGLKVPAAIRRVSSPLEMLRDVTAAATSAEAGVGCQTSDDRSADPASAYPHTDLL